MKKLNGCLVENKLSLNVSKTKFMIFHRFDNYLDPVFDSFDFGQGVVERVDSFEYLGLVLDSGLTFENHVNKVIKKIRPYVAILSRVKYYLPIKSLKMLYYAHIHSHVHYMLPLYGRISSSWRSSTKKALNTFSSYIICILPLRSTIRAFPIFAHSPNGKRFY